jgi:SAM-dependent methyltransferase
VDVGCGNMPYRSLFPSGWSYVGLDIDDAKDRFKYDNASIIHYDGKFFPLDDDSMDVVFHSEVIEHVPDTNNFLKECHRVLSPCGEMVFTVPFSARYHYIPNDFWRFTPSGLKCCLEKAGFTDISVAPRSRDVCVAAYKVLIVGYRLFFSKNILKMIIAVLFAPLWILSLVIGQVSLWLNLGSDEDCLGYIVYCRKGEPINEE